MNYLLVSQISKKWNISKRTVRNYFAKGKINGAFLTGKKWNIPEDTKKPNRINKKYSKPKTLFEILQFEKKNKIAGGIYHKIQIDLTFNSNHIEGSKLTIEQTRYIFETNTIGIGNQILNSDDIIETANHFKCIDVIIESAKKTISEKFIKEFA